MWMWSYYCKSEARLDGKTCVITGCNTGIGKCTAQDLYKRGGRIIMACRDMGRATAAKEDIMRNLKDYPNVGTLVLKKLDLSCLDSVKTCADEILHEETRIDILINNAGVVMFPNKRTKDGFEMHFGVNHLGHFLLTWLLLPKLLEAPHARIISLGSCTHFFYKIDFDDINWEKRPHNPSRAYIESKISNILFIKELAKRLKGTNVHTYAVSPGVALTDATRFFDKSVIPGATWIANFIGSLVVKTPYQGAQTIIYCAVDEKAGTETGLYYGECAVAATSEHASDPEAAEKLWTISEKLLNIKT